MYFSITLLAVCRLPNNNSFFLFFFHCEFTDYETNTYYDTDCHLSPNIQLFPLSLVTEAWNLSYIYGPLA